MDRHEYVTSIDKQLETEEDNIIRERLYALRRKIVHAKNMSEYEMQANYFLAKTDTTLRIIFLKTGKYFTDDTEARDIYTCILSRNNKDYDFTFGQSLKDTKLKRKPNAYNILSCIEKYKFNSFEEFCAFYGYNNDSIKDYKIYEKVEEQGAAICAMFSDCIDELRNIQ